MLKTKMKQLLTALAISTAVAAMPTSAIAAEKGMTSIEEGKKLAFSRSKGNCLACHMVPGGSLAGNIGPAIIAMKARYPDKKKLYNKVWGKPDSQILNSMMPPFGQNGSLTDDEIKKIVDFIYTL